MLLNELLTLYGGRILSRGTDGNPEVTDITYDSRRVTSGTLYVAVPGTKVHGDRFINSAIAHGAVAVVSENAHPECPVPWVQVQEVRKCCGVLGKKLWSIPLDTITTVGITGTNGKTTVAHLYEALYRMRKSPETVWMFGTIDFHIAGRSLEASHTTPESLDVFRTIGTGGIQPAAVVMEVSSHALSLDRISGMEYDLAVFTNLTQDHLDFHKDMDSYFNAKSSLFKKYLNKDGCAVVNVDDGYGRRLAALCGDNRCVTYGQDEDAHCRITSWECSWDGTSVTVLYRGISSTFTSGLTGFFTVYNMAAMIAGALAEGFDVDEIQRAFTEVAGVAGRMQRILPEAPFAVVIDYAHTPDALANVLRTAKDLTRGRLFCVFGCGGDRDRTKRPLMGAAVAALCDEAWVTSDNPRSENPATIINEIVAGVPLDFPCQIQEDRAAALHAAMSEGRPGDCLVIAGKGHETYQEIAGIKHHFDDRETAEKMYRELHAEG